MGPALRPGLVPAVKLRHGQTATVRAASNFVQGDQAVVVIKDSILKPLGHDRAGNLLPALDEVQPLVSPLAGKTLVFDITVNKILSDPIEKLKAVIKRRIPALPEDEYQVTISAKTITIELPKESRYIENIQYGEIGLASDALKVVESANEVKLMTVWPRPEEPKENTT